MRMTIAGVHRYTVRVTEQRIFDPAGEELEGVAIESRRLILISPTVQPERREEILGHELTHAWGFHVPPPRTEEERCQLNATIKQQLRLDLEREGGIEALAALKPEPVSLPYKAPPARKAGAMVLPTRDWWECGTCSARMMCGSIESGPVEFVESLQQHQMQRWFRCEVCDALNTWKEVATSDGQPTGSLVQVPAPRVLHGAAAREWMAENANVKMSTTT